jgi:phage portal protein BeeE
MMGWLKTAGGLGRKPAPAETKESRTGRLVALHSAGQPVWTAPTYKGLARAGYMKNPVVYRAVRMIAEAASSHSASDGFRPVPKISRYASALP